MSATPHPEPSSREATVTQIDREAAARLHGFESWAELSAWGARDSHMDAALAFARHRLAAEQSRASTPAAGREDDEPSEWAIAAERAAMDAYAEHMGDPDGRDDGHAARMAAARAIEQHAILALHPPASDDPSHPRWQGCNRPPDGWWCSRKAGHDGPCPTRRLGEN